MSDLKTWGSTFLHGNNWLEQSSPGTERVRPSSPRPHCSVSLQLLELEILGAATGYLALPGWAIMFLEARFLPGCQLINTGTELWGRDATPPTPPLFVLACRPLPALMWAINNLGQHYELLSTQVTGGKSLFLALVPHSRSPVLKACIFREAATCERDRLHPEDAVSRM